MNHLLMIVGHLVRKLESRLVRVHQIEEFPGALDMLEKTTGTRNVHFAHWPATLATTPRISGGVALRS